jgi:tetratricopeptide (TPR) repeat protein
MLKFPFRLVACAALVALPVAAVAQTESYYVPPKLVQPGKNTAALAGPGNVTVQVQVKKDGTFSVIKVTKSTNAGDNAAALEIANSSKYKPATRDAKPVDAYYDYELKFGGDTAATGTGGIATALATIRAGKYDDAKAQLQTYLQAHPDDTQANTLLGVADTFGGDPVAAAAAFDKAGTIPDQYKTLALQSYEKSANAALQQKKFPEAIAAANHAIDLNPQSLQGYYVRGNAETGMQNNAAAIVDLQKARTIAAAGKSDAKTTVALAFSLAEAQLNAGQFGEAATSAKEVARLDTTISNQLTRDEYVAVMNPAIALANAGKISESVGRLESGAAAFPANAGPLTAQAAYILATDKKPDWDRVKAEAEKAIALDPNSGRSDYILGIVASQKQDPKTALDYMNKAKATPDYGTDASLAKMIDNALKQLNAGGK